MTLKITALAALVCGLATPALAQTAVDPASLKVGPIESTAEAKALIGAPLDTTLSGGSGEAEGDIGPLYVIGGNNVKPAGEWTEADKKACDAAGGIELPISAGRIACIRL